MKSGILLIFILLASHCIYSQGVNMETRAGSFIVRNYTSKENGGNAQIFEIAQDARGIMYFANQRGVLEYDGITWKTIFVGDDEKKVLSLNTNKKGEILVGAVGDFGILKSDSVGEVVFESLLESAQIDSIGIVTKILVYDEMICLKTEHEVILLKNEILYARHNYSDEVTCIAHTENRLFMAVQNQGLYEFRADGFEIVSKDHNLLDYQIMDVTAYAGKILLVTDAGGFFELKDGKVKHLPSEIDHLDVYNTYHTGENLTIGTFSHGVLGINEDFEIILEVGIDKGISDATVRSQFIDREGNLWIGTNVGISKIAINEPVLKYGKSAGLTSGVESIERFNEQLYFATQNGVYTLKNKTFDKLDGLGKDCYGVRTLVFGEDTLLFMAGVQDVLVRDRFGKLTNIEEGGPYDFLKSPLDSNDLIVLHWDGVAKLRYDNGEFTEQRYLTGWTSQEPFNFLIDPDGTIWMGTLNEEGFGIYKGHIDMFQDSIPDIQHLGEEEGLLPGASYLFRHDNDLFVGSDDGLFIYENGKFRIYNDFGFDFSSLKYGVHRINEDPEGNIWMVIFDEENNYEIGYAYQTDGKYEWISTPFKRYSNEIIHAIFHDANGITWLGGPAGLLRFDNHHVSKYDEPFKAIVRSVKYGNVALYKGGVINEGNLETTVDFASSKAIGFEFSAASFIDEDQNLFSFYMEGQDEKWSEWTSRNIKEYNLDPGSYVFHLKAKNVYGDESEEVTYRIIVLPPWYQTIWAYVIYGVVLVLFIYGIIRLSIYRIRQKNIQLEKIVDQRTQEVVVQKEEAEKQRDLAETQKKIADEQKEIVEEKNREIVDSINYAKRIQEAIMPSLSSMKESLSNSFVLYLPKDVVAGDFFWMEKIGDVVYYAAADCTGHGVPGAMVSVVCSGALTKALLEEGIRDTGLLLDRTREIVIEKFARSGEEVKDGMDISLCALNVKNLKLQWSGANNPIWILRDGAEEFEEIKANKQPIGKFDRATPFTSHQIQLNEGDTIYVFTDGYQDQFGGPKGKKFKATQLKKLILEDRTMSMADQLNKLESTFASWKGDIEQIDDVCVIGVRV